jgi:hypothetical protein
MLRDEMSNYAWSTRLQYNEESTKPSSCDCCCSPRPTPRLPGCVSRVCLGLYDTVHSVESTVERTTAYTSYVIVPYCSFVKETSQSPVHLPDERGLTSCTVRLPNTSTVSYVLVLYHGVQTILLHTHLFAMMMQTRPVNSKQGTTVRGG